MSRLYNAFLLFGETKNPSELVQETKEHLKPFTQTKQLILSRDTIKGNNNLFCLHDRQALCLELFTSRILFRQTDTQASLQKKKSET
uniref:AlNc14C196G8576 protein n=1 Tax=Albugo laibachii Nc14 TaxID=890382 RepID=F0WQ95_9STRA|nr:AlNc14C196G8576 [Albugo laibachii Nc14]|eukprot:CCA23501.1 AlNc14C196G8576 [Albugo laibachii Nc14]